MSQQRKFTRKINARTIVHEDKGRAVGFATASDETATTPSDVERMRKLVEVAEGKPLAKAPGALKRAAYMIKALAYVALAAYVFLIRSQPRQALGWFAAAIAYAAMAKDKGVS